MLYRFPLTAEKWGSNTKIRSVVSKKLFWGDLVDRFHQPKATSVWSAVGHVARGVAKAPYLNDDDGGRRISENKKQRKRENVQSSPRVYYKTLGFLGMGHFCLCIFVAAVL